MATLELIRSQLDDSLDELEREMVRQVIGIDGKAGSANRTESEVRMDALLPEQNQIVRALLIDYDDISFDTTRIHGGGDGVDVDPTRNKLAIANELRRMLYPTEYHDPLLTTDNGSSIKFIPITYNTGSAEYN